MRGLESSFKTFLYFLVDFAERAFHPTSLLQCGTATKKVVYHTYHMFHDMICTWIFFLFLTIFLIHLFRNIPFQTKKGGFLKVAERGGNSPFLMVHFYFICTRRSYSPSCHYLCEEREKKQRVFMFVVIPCKRGWNDSVGCKKGGGDRGEKWFDSSPEFFVKFGKMLH